MTDEFKDVAALGCPGPASATPRLRCALDFARFGRPSGGSPMRFLTRVAAVTRVTDEV